MGKIVQPVASSLVESLRAFGYSFETAVADIIDNSMTATAKCIDIKFEWSGADSTLAIIDDGIGMNSEELLEAMRPGNVDPLQERDKNDLGRFGLGLKTASFSQCRRLVVCSKKADRDSIFCWDLDVIKEKQDWILLDSEDLVNVGKYTNYLADKASGTAVFWEKIDRICGELDSTSQQHHSKFLEMVESLNLHLGMIFHRFLSLPNGPKIQINTSKIKSWDPFLSGHVATQEKPTDSICYQGKRISSTSFILPHYTKLTKDEYKYGAGIRGWNDHQGFYIYRNKRLLISGNWLGIGGTKDEHTKLARIRIDLPNTLDQEWHIDVKKSKAIPPPVLKEQLKIIATKARSAAESIYRHRGKIVKRTSSNDDITFVWNRIKRRGKHIFKLNKNYPLINRFTDSLPTGLKRDFTSLLNLIGETIPNPAIVITHSEEPDSIGKPYEGSKKQLIDLGINFARHLLEAGNSKNKALSIITSIEPFDSYPEIIDTIKRELSNER